MTFIGQSTRRFEDTRFLTGQGRRKFVAPLFASLWAQGDWGQAIARRIYAISRPLYHAVTRDTVDRTVK